MVGSGGYATLCTERQTPSVLISMSMELKIVILKK